MLNLKVQGKYILFTVALSLSTILSCTFIYLILLQKQSENLVEQLTAQSVKGFRQATASQAGQMSEYLAAALFDPLYNFNPDRAAVILNPLLKVQQISKIVVFDHKGRIFHDGSKLLLNFGDYFNNPAVLKTVLRNREEYKKFAYNQYRFSRPIMVNNRLLGGLYMEFSLDELNSSVSDMSGLLQNITEENKQKLMISKSVVIFIISTVSVILAILIARSVSKPIARLIQYTKHIGAADFSSASLMLSPRRNDELGELALAFSSMSSELEKKTRRIAFQAYHDPLTELPNRMHFMQQINRWIERDNSRFTILFLDLDNFKYINDNYGHIKGDVLLIQMAERLRNVVGSYRSASVLDKKVINQPLVSRIGGDEFLIYLPYIHREKDVQPVISKLLDSISKPLDIGSEQLVVNASIGVASYPKASHSLEDLIKFADIAMYHAKKDGKDTYKFFCSSMNDTIIQRALVEKELRKALDDPDQFELWYQPLIDLDSQRIIGAEALVR